MHHWKGIHFNAIHSYFFATNIGPNDFEPLDTLMLTFPSSTSVGVNQCQSVTIVGDNIRENDEMFQVLVTPADSDDMVTGSSTFNITINSEPGDSMSCYTTLSGY